MKEGKNIKKKVEKEITLCYKDISEECGAGVKKEKTSMIPSQESLTPSRIAC